MGKNRLLIHEDWDYNMHLLKFTKTLKAGETYKFSVVASATSTEHYNDPLNEAERLTIFAKLEGTERLLQRHSRNGKNFGRVILSLKEILTRKEQLDLHCIICIPLRAKAQHIACRQWVCLVWDITDMFFGILSYGCIRLYWCFNLKLQDHCWSIVIKDFLRRRQNAFSHGYKGAMFPWESSDEGSEDTPVWALTGPFQHHISGCVGWAAWKYYQVTKDKIWLRDRGYPLLKGGG